MRIFTGFLNIWIRNYLWTMALIVAFLVASHSLGLAIESVWTRYFDWTPAGSMSYFREWLEKWPFLGYRSPTYFFVVLIFAVFHFILIFQFRTLFRNAAFRRTQVRYYAMLTVLGFFFELLSFGLQTWTFPEETHFSSLETFIPIFGHIFLVTVPFEELFWIILVVPLFHYFNLWIDWCSHDIHFYFETQEFMGIKEDRLVRVRKDFVGAHEEGGKPRGTFIVLHRLSPISPAASPEHPAYPEHQTPPSPPGPGDDLQVWARNLENFDQRYSDRVIDVARRQTNFPHVLFRWLDRIQLVLKRRALKFLRSPALERIVPAVLATACLVSGFLAWKAGYTYEGLELALEGFVISLALQAFFRPTDREFFELDGDSQPASPARNDGHSRLPEGLLTFAFLIILPVSLVAHYFAVVQGNWIYPTQNAYFLGEFNLADIKGGVGEILFRDAKPIPVIEYFFYFFFSIFQFACYWHFLRMNEAGKPASLLAHLSGMVGGRFREVPDVLRRVLVACCVLFLFASCLPALWDIWNGTLPKPDYNLYILGSMAMVILYAQAASPSFRDALRTRRLWLYLLSMSAFVCGWELLHVAHYGHWSYCLDKSYFPAWIDLGAVEGCRLGLSLSQPFGYLFTACVFPAFFYLVHDARGKSQSTNPGRPIC